METVASTSVEDRTWLANRAKERRLALKLKMKDVSGQMCVSPNNFKQWEVSLRASPDVKAEMAWEVALNVPKGWLRNANIETPVAESCSEMKSMSIQGNSVSDEIMSLAAWVSKRSNVGRTTNYALLNDDEKRQAEMYAMRYGVYGEDVCSLQAIGTKFGLTREGVRQNIERMKKSIKDVDLNMPMLTRFRDELQGLLPIKLVDADLKLKGTLGKAASTKGVIRFCADHFQGEDADLVSVTGSGAECILIDRMNHQPMLVQLVRDLTLRMLRTVGAGQLNYLVGEVVESYDKAVKKTEVVGILKTLEGFEWLEEADGWFWLGEAFENRLINVTKKILSVGGRRVDVVEIAEGMNRGRSSYVGENRQRPCCIDMPATIAQKALSKLSWLKVIQHDDFKSVEELDPAKLLSRTEFLIVEMMKGKGGVASRTEIEKYVVSFGEVGTTSVNICLASSPIFKKLGTGVFCLRGEPISGKAYEAALKNLRVRAEA